MKDFMAGLVAKWDEQGYRCVICSLDDPYSMDCLSRCFSTVDGIVIRNTMVTVAKLLGSLPFQWEGPEDGYLLVSGSDDTNRIVRDIISEVPWDTVVAGCFKPDGQSIMARGETTAVLYLACRTLQTIDRVGGDGIGLPVRGPIIPVNFN
jgi:hypothetical protein